MRKVTIFAGMFSLLMAAVLLVGCGGGGSNSTSGTPEQVAEAFWTAALKGQVDTSWNMLSKSIRAALKDKSTWAKSVRNDQNASVKVGKATITGNTAKVTVKILSSGTEVTTSDVSMVKENGVWKIELP